VLDLCREECRREPAAATTLARWRAWQEALAGGCSGAESRFQRRAYERAREAAMGVLVMALVRRGGRPPRRRGVAARGGKHRRRPAAGLPGWRSAVARCAQPDARRAL